MATEQSDAPALPFPLDYVIQVYHDDGQWDAYDAWFMRDDSDLTHLWRDRWTLDTDDDGYVKLSLSAWRTLADKLVRDYPGCVFIYAHA